VYKLQDINLLSSASKITETNLLIEPKLKTKTISYFLVFVLMISSLGGALVSVYLLGVNGTTDTRRLLLIIVSTYFTLQWFALSRKSYANKIVIFLPAALILTSIYKTRDFSPLVALVIFSSLLGWGHLITILLRIQKLQAAILFPLFGQAVLSALMVVAASGQMMQFIGGLFISIGILVFTQMIVTNREFKNFLNFSKSHKQSNNSPISGVFKVSMSVIFSMHALVALAPDLGFDSLQNKSWLPRQWNNSMDILLNTNHILNGVTSSQTFVVYLGNLLGSPTTGSKLQFLYLLYTYILIYNFISQKTKEQWTFTLYVLVVGSFSLPILLFQSSSGYDDSFLLLLCTSAFIFSFNRDKRTPGSNVFLIGAIAGALISAKFTLLPFSFAIILTYILDVIRMQEKLLHKVRKILALIVVTILVSSPLYIYKYLNYQNPLWPLFNGFFRAPTLPLTNEHFNFPMGKSLDLSVNFLAPFVSFFRPDYWGEEGTPAIYGLLLLLVYLTFFIALALRKELGIGPFLLISVFLVNWWLNFRYLRYLIPLIGITIVMFVFYLTKNNKLKKSSANELKLTKLPTVALLSLGIMSAVALPIGNSSSPQRIPLEVALGSIDKNQYLREVTPIWGVASYLNETTPKNSIIVTNVMHQALWLRPDIELYSYWEILRNSSIKPNFAVILSSQNAASQIGSISESLCSKPSLDFGGISVIRICK
jgi:hypothetical protein